MTTLAFHTPTMIQALEGATDLGGRSGSGLRLAAWALRVSANQPGRDRRISAVEQFNEEPEWPIFLTFRVDSWVYCCPTSHLRVRASTSDWDGSLSEDLGRHQAKRILESHVYEAEQQRSDDVDAVLKLDLTGRTGTSLLRWQLTSMVHIRAVAVPISRPHALLAEPARSPYDSNAAISFPPCIWLQDRNAPMKTATSKSAMRTIPRRTATTSKEHVTVDHHSPRLPRLCQSVRMIL